MGNDLYVVMHDVEQIGKKPVIVTMAGNEKTEYEKGNFDKLLERVVKKEDPAFSNDQLGHFKAVQKYKLDVKNDPKGEASLDITCYDAQQQPQQRVVNGTRTTETNIKASDLVQPYIIRDQKTKVNEAYDKLEMIVGYNPGLGRTMFMK